MSIARLTARLPQRSAAASISPLSTLARGTTLSKRLFSSDDSHQHPAECPCCSQADRSFYHRGMSPADLTEAPLVSPEVIARKLTRPADHTQALYERGVRTRQHVRRVATQAASGETYDYAFDYASSNIRFGPGVTREVGLDCRDMGAKRVCVITDPYLAKLPVMDIVRQSLDDAGVNFVEYAETRVEPTDKSVQHAIAFAQEHDPDLFLAVGGGSVIDTAKAANLYSCYREDFLTFVNPPIGQGKPVPGPVKPLIAVPTTAGTGSETTGVAIFDFADIHVKTGISHKRLKPTLGIIDPDNTLTMPVEVAVASGLDVLCHSMESYTAIPFNQRSPRPSQPSERPPYQGSNPFSDHWSYRALEIGTQNLPEIVKDPGNAKAREQMMLASTFAGVGFGNAGVHLCHALSYPTAGLVQSYHHPGYANTHPLVPHGIAVALTAPAVFKWTSSANPEKHREMAREFGINTDSLPSTADVGARLSDALASFLHNVGVPTGLGTMGYTREMMGDLVKGALAQKRLTANAPMAVDEGVVTQLFDESFGL